MHLSQLARLSFEHTGSIAAAQARRPPNNQGLQLFRRVERLLDRAEHFA
jgi:hypothetical protein